MIEPGAHIALEAAYHTEARRVRTTLIRLLSDFDAAEEALQEAFAVAAERWPNEGMPSNTYSWLVSVGRFKTVDGWRRGMAHQGLAEAHRASRARSGGDDGRTDRG
jgi:RNA polymerase sigma-70 factor (ECF subfamily)